MATTVTGALLAIYTANSALVALAPKFWFGEAPENMPATATGTLIPYLVLTHEGEDVDWNSEGGIETTRCTLHAFAEGAATVETIVAAIKAAYDFAPLTISGVADMGVMRTGYTLTPDGRATDTDLVFHGAVSFIVRVNRTRTR